MPTAAVLPIKSFTRAKQRLSDAVGDPQRAQLAEAMVGDVLAALGHVGGLDLVVAVTAERTAAEQARAAGATVVDDPAEAGQSAAAALGIDEACRQGADRVLLVPGDCPALDPDEVGSLLGREADVVIVPDRHGSGTNALLLAPPQVIEPSFGPGSLARHAALARAAGAEVRVAELPSLGLDVDTPGDLQALRLALAGRTHGAERTRELLARLLPAPAAAG